MVQLHRLRLSVDDSSLIPVLDEIRAEAGLPKGFPEAVLAQAERACRQWAQAVAGLRLAAPAPEDPSTRVSGPAPGPSADAPRAAGAPVAEAPDGPLDYRRLTSWPRLDLAPAAHRWPDLDPAALPSWDATAIPFVTVDPEGSRDLDQAVHLHRLTPADRERAPRGATVLVSYAIASLATFVPAGSPLDDEVRSRGLTVYMPDRSTPLHPPVLSEGAASLLPGQVAPACVWQILLDAEGHRLGAAVRRAVVRSRAQLSYDEVEAARVRGRGLPGVPDDFVALLEEVGRARRLIETGRGGVSAPTPEQEIIRIPEVDGGSHYALEFRANALVEEWNAQISLLTGMCAAEKMRAAGVGILRTVPEAPESAMRRMRAVARVLGVDWPSGMPYARLVPELDPTDPAHASFLIQAMGLYRGAAYTVFSDRGLPEAGGAPAGEGAGHGDSGEATVEQSTAEPFPRIGDESARHAAIGAEYAHTTAPLRRLVDRWSSEICLAHDAGEPIPEWVVESVSQVPSIMARARQRAAAAERAAVGAVSAKLLVGHEGEAFDGVIVESRGRDRRRDRDGAGEEPGRSRHAGGGEAPSAPSGDSGRRGSDGGPGEEEPERGRVMVADPAVMAPVVARGSAELPVGDETRVRLIRADVERRSVEFAWPAS
ncbi:RNB domain-containing ribonuclease [Actinomyces sp. B33]|uniref:RNB domain-containing ribonuclease n=1 Tax=Actinomyces sp. B33 TaxID=2942131 RepID=UPI002342617E|nr:RNB domain-containing ribonuclease [Actinomyces sp. B33]MDC4233471.1 RNB domain-containing ribonuclease [Actinomyces sp. B33]